MVEPRRVLGSHPPVREQAFRRGMILLCRRRVGFPAAGLKLWVLGICFIAKPLPGLALAEKRKPQYPRTVSVRLSGESVSWTLYCEQFPRIENGVSRLHSSVRRAFAF